MPSSSKLSRWMKIKVIFLTSGSMTWINCLIHLFHLLLFPEERQYPESCPVKRTGMVSRITRGSHGEVTRFIAGMRHDQLSQLPRMLCQSGCGPVCWRRYSIPRRKGKELDVFKITMSTLGLVRTEIFYTTEERLILFSPLASCDGNLYKTVA